MNKNILRTARRFLHKELNSKVDFATVSAYLQKIGFSVVIYESDKDNDILQKYNLVERSKTVKGFTLYTKNFKAVFVDNSSCREEKLCTLMHETAHIILDHINKTNTIDNRIAELEADAFTYNVLYPQSDTKICKTIAICTTALCLGAMAVMIKQNRGVSDT